MHRALMIAVLGILSTPSITWAHSPIGAVVAHRHVGGACGCGQAIPAPVAPVIQPTCNTCDSCNSCGGYGGGCGSSLCANRAEFYRQLYAEFYAKNQWYLVYRQQEAAARRARMYGLEPQTAPVIPAK